MPMQHFFFGRDIQYFTENSLYQIYQIEQYDWLHWLQKNTKYLGINMDNELKWDVHIENMCQKLSKLIGFSDGYDML